MARLFGCLCMVLAAASQANAQINIIDLRCEPIAGEDYTASVSGSLVVNDYHSYSFYAGGDTEVTLIALGNTVGPQRVEANGTFYFDHSADITFGEDAAQGVLRLSATSPNWSRFGGTDGHDYWTDCSTSTIHLPLIPDLVPTSTIRTWREPGSISAQMWFDVTNVGNATVPSGPVRISLDGTSVQARLTAGPGGLEPGDTREIYFTVSNSAFQRCREYTAQIDLDHQLQEAPFDTYSNDTAIVKTSCLSWKTVIDTFSYGAPPSSLIAGKTIEAIINSQVSGRSDGKLCSGCHTGPDTPNKNRVPAGEYISPTRAIGGATWATYPGLLEWFIGARPGGNPKPAHLVQLFSIWRRDGALNDW